MMEKPKPEEQEVEEELPVTVDDREAEIERRLAALEVDVDETETEPQVEETVEETKEEEEEPVVQVKEVEPVPVVPPPVVQEKPVAEPVKPNNKSALLARIMAAQERAKQAQVKQQAAPMVAPVSTSTTTSSMQAETQKMMEALNGLETKKPEPPSFASASSLLEPTMKPAVEAPVKPPPPSFDIFEKQMAAAAPPIMSTQTAPPPPAFDSIAPTMLHAPSTTTNTTMSNADADFLSGFTKPVAPPPQPAAPSFDQIMQQNLMAPPPTTTEMKSEEDEALDFALDENGMELTPEAKQKLMEEQRAIMEHIKQQQVQNKASEAAIKADAFANRMTGQSVDGFSASEVEEQRRILAQIEEQKHSSKAQNIDIGNGQNVQLHGEEMTQAAIEKGNAQLVLCLNCNNWMQVVDSATLMYCPICSVVTPVVKQNDLMSQEEMLQMEQDRKLAEMLQNEENAAAASSGSSEYPGNRRSATLRSGGAANAAEKSWWDTISDAMVSVGITADAPSQQQQQAAAASRSSYMPPGSNQRMLHSAVTGEEVDDQHVGLLSSEGGGRPSARVAQSQPLFSCVVDSISSTVNEASTYLMGDEEEEVNGVDSSSLLATPNIGREKEGSGRYFALPPQD